MLIRKHVQCVPLACERLVVSVGATRLCFCDFCHFR